MAVYKTLFIIIITSCLNELKVWMSTNFQKLNIDKTNVLDSKDPKWE